jgi:hypothetical protein
MPQSVSKALSINVAPVAPLAISTASLPDATEFQPYSQQLTATGGTTPYHWVGTAGAFPTGLSMSDSGLISGVPSASGPFDFTVQVTDSGA